MLGTFWCKEVVKRVNERTNYKLDLSDHWGGRAAKLGEILRANEMGLPDIGAYLIVIEPAKLHLNKRPYFFPFCSPEPAGMARITPKLTKQFSVMTDTFPKYNLKIPRCVYPGQVFTGGNILL